jgi:hypothetical protein
MEDTGMPRNDCTFCTDRYTQPHPSSALAESPVPTVLLRYPNVGGKEEASDVIWGLLRLHDKAQPIFWRARGHQIVLGHFLGHFPGKFLQRTQRTQRTPMIVRTTHSFPSATFVMDGNTVEALAAHAHAHAHVQAQPAGHALAPPHSPSGSRGGGGSTKAHRAHHGKVAAVSHDDSASSEGFGKFMMHVMSGGVVAEDFSWDDVDKADLSLHLSTLCTALLGCFSSFGRAADKRDQWKVDKHELWRTNRPIKSFVELYHLLVGIRKDPAYVSCGYAVGADGGLVDGAVKRAVEDTCTPSRRKAIADELDFSNGVYLPPPGACPIQSVLKTFRVEANARLAIAALMAVRFGFLVPGFFLCKGWYGYGYGYRRRRVLHLVLMSCMCVVVARLFLVQSFAFATATRWCSFVLDCTLPSMPVPLVQWRRWRLRLERFLASGNLRGPIMYVA